MRIGLTMSALATFAVSFETWVAAPHAWHPAGLAAAGVLGPLAMLLLVAGVPAGLRLITTPKRALREALVLLAVVSAVLAVASGNARLTLVSATLLIALVLARGLWPELSDERASRRGWSLLFGAGIALVGLFLLDRVSGPFVVVVTLVLFAALASTVLGIVLLMRNAPLPLESHTGPAAAVYAAHASAGVSPYALMRDKRWFWSRDGKAFLAYGARAGVAVVLGPAIGPQESVRALYGEFQHACHLRGWKLGLYQVSADFSTALGWGTRYPIGSEAIVDLTNLTLEGPAMAKLRHEVSRGKRNGVTVQLMPVAALTPLARTSMAELAADWAKGHAFGEMSFSVGHRADQPAAPTMVGLAYDKANQLVAYTTWLALPAGKGMVLDQIRRTQQTPPGAMDLLLYTCMDQFRQQATWVSLGVAPVASVPASRLHRVAGEALERLGIASVSTSLFSFKQKFQPQWQPRYLVAERAADWPAVAVATLLLHYPSLEQRARRVVPSAVSSRRLSRLGGAVAFALVATGASGIIAAAAQSRQGHPLYSAHAVAAEVITVLPFTGSSEVHPQAPTAVAETRPAHVSQAPQGKAGERLFTSISTSRANPDVEAPRHQVSHKPVVGVEARISVFERQHPAAVKKSPIHRPARRH